MSQASCYLRVRLTSAQLNQSDYAAENTSISNMTSKELQLGERIQPGAGKLQTCETATCRKLPSESNVADTTSCLPNLVLPRAQGSAPYVTCNLPTTLFQVIPWLGSVVNGLLHVLNHWCLDTSFWLPVRKGPWIVCFNKTCPTLRIPVLRAMVPKRSSEPLHAFTTSCGISPAATRDSSFRRRNGAPGLFLTSHAFQRVPETVLPIQLPGKGRELGRHLHKRAYAVGKSTGTTPTIALCLGYHEEVRVCVVSEATCSPTTVRIISEAKEAPLILTKIMLSSTVSTHDCQIVT